MSWLFSRVLVEGYLEGNSLGGEQFAPLSGNNTPQAYLCNGKTTSSFRLSRFGMTLEPLTENLGEDLLTWFREDSLAKILAPQVKEQVSTESEVQCGSTCSESSKKSNHLTALLRTPLTFVLKDLSPSSKDLPKQGIMRRGVCYPLKTVEPITNGSECGLLEKELLPTPTCTANQLAPSMTKHKGCRALQALLPTPVIAGLNGGAGSRTLLQKYNSEMLLTQGRCLGGRPHPNFTEWMMGWPSGWTDLKPLETGKCLNALPQHGES